MRRTLGLMLAFLVTAALMSAAPANAGYLIIRIILEGGEGGGDAGGGPPRSGPGAGSGPFQPGGKMGSGQFKGGPGPGMGGPGPAPAGKPAHTDPAQCVVAVVPFEEDYTKLPRPFYPSQPQKSISNPARKDQLRINYRGERLTVNLFTDATTIQWYDELTNTPFLTRTRVYEVLDLHARWARTMSDPKVLMTAVTTALGIGQVDLAIQYADELLAAYNQAADKAAFPADIQAFAKAYAKVQAGIKTPTPAPKPARIDFWRLKLNAKVYQGDHYAVLYGESTTEEDVTRRLSFLDENFKAFFLWYALRGIDLPFPEDRLLVVLTNGGTTHQPGGIDVHTLARTLDGPARLGADGFYAPDHDLLVLSPDRIDDVGVNFNHFIQPVYQEGVGRDKLLTGYGPKIGLGQKADEKKADEVARMQTIALVDRFVDDAAMCATISREGCRQLLYATHQLPKYVALPQWLSNGSGNFFARAKEPAFVTNEKGKPLMHVAMATGYGVPNYNLQRYFKEYYKDMIDRARDEAKKRVNPRYDGDALRVALLKHVLNDSYFRALAAPGDIHDPDPTPEGDGPKAIVLGGTDQKEPATGGAGLGGPGPGGFRPPMGGGPGPGGQRPPGGGSGSFRPGMGGPGTGSQPAPKSEDDPVLQQRKAREKVAIKAQATAWALYYYLAKARPDGLRAFEAELATLPRDLPLEGASVTAFYRAFNLDPAKDETLRLFARNWMDYIHSVAPAGIDVLIHEPKPPEEKKDGIPGGPGFPGK